MRISHSRRRLIPNLSGVRKPCLHLLLVLHQRAARAEVGLPTILERGALDSKTFTELASFDHKQDPVEAAVAGECVEAALWIQVAVSIIAYLYEKTLDNAYITVDVLVLLQSGVLKARLGLAEQAAWCTPADET